MQAFRILAVFLALGSAAAFEKGPTAQPSSPASDLGRRILAAGLDPAECYRIRDLEISEEDARIYLTDGYIMFGKPVEGAPLTAVFSADTDGGDAEVLLLPPNRSERKTMAAYTGAPNLDEHFAQAAFIFTETSARNLIKEVHSSEQARKAPEIGAIMMERWNRVVTNLMSGFESRMVLDLLSPGDNTGFFQAIISGRKLGNFDVIYDGRGYEQMLAGQINERNGASYWDTWTSFVGHTHKGLPAVQPEEKILSYNIDAKMDADLTMHCVTRIRVRTTEASRKLLAFDLSGQMHATGAKIDGVPAEVYERESVRQGLVQNTGNELLLVLPDQPLDPETEHEVEIDHEGKVVRDIGHEVYFVTARGSWYPSRGIQFAAYDVTYEYPATLDLVAAGKVKADRIDGDLHITRRVPEDRLRILGFNLGHFEKMETARNGISIEALANRQVEDALRPRLPEPSLPPLEIRTRRGVPPVVNPDLGRPPLPPPPPVNQLSQIANEVQDAMAFYRQRLGDPLIHHLEVTPLPGRFGQGFGGMIYLPTINYLLGDAILTNKDQAIFRDLLVAHEVAHQWWGNIVATASYHNEWLMEALSNYCALMYIESKYGPHGVDVALDLYRHNMFTKGPDGETPESVGPIVQGRRLESSVNPNAAIVVMYGKGSWIIHMLRRRMGDERFLKMLAELRRRYQFQSVDVEQFRAICAEFLPPNSPDPKLENFFDQWVYGTGVPALKMTYAVKGTKLTGTITQSDVDDDFNVPLPIEIQTGRGKIIKTVTTSSEPVTFSVNVTGPGAKAILDPSWSVLKR